MIDIQPDLRILQPSLGRRSVTECLGTFALVLVGTGAIVVNDLTAGALTHLGIALAFGLVVMILISSLGEISGSHLNPAVTIGLAAARRFPWRDCLAYIPAQCLGAILASLLVKFLFESHPHYGSTIPRGSSFQSFVIEFLLTTGLMLVILRTTIGPTEKTRWAAIVIGSVVGMEALVAGPITGASMNPARSLGPALVAGLTQHLWIYLTGPMLGGLCGMLTCRAISEPGCCEDSNCE